MRSPNRRSSNRWSKTVLAFAAFSLLPIYWLVVLSFQPNRASETTLNLIPSPPTVQHYSFIFFNQDWVDGYWNAAVYVFLNVFLTLVVSLPAAYGFSRFRFAGDRQAFFFVLVFRMIPPAVVMIPFFEMFSDLGLIDTHMAVAIAHCMFTVPIAIWILEGFIGAIPTEMEEIADVDGYSRFGFFLKILFPQIRVGIAVTAFFCFVFSWAELILANSLTTVQAKPIGVIMKIVASPVGQVHIGIASAASVLMLIPGTIFLWLLRKHLVRGLSMGRVA
ncbi:Trehalose transport system permease protein SugB [Roseibium album]|nr:Trehalose transport system permease protein SugB [Roseibium album]